MSGSRDKLIKRNENFIQLPMPNLSKMTDDELEKRANHLDYLFQIAFEDSEVGEVEDL